MSLRLQIIKEIEKESCKAEFIDTLKKYILLCSGSEKDALRDILIYFKNMFLDEKMNVESHAIELIERVKETVKLLDKIIKRTGVNDLLVVRNVINMKVTYVQGLKRLS